MAGDGTGDHAVGRAAPYRPTWMPGRRLLYWTGSEFVIYDDKSGGKHALGSFQHVFDPAVERSPGQSKAIYHGDVVFRGTRHLRRRPSRRLTGAGCS